MKDYSIRTYICEKCGKKFTIQCVSDLLVKKCCECYMDTLRLKTKNKRINLRNNGILL